MGSITGPKVLLNNSIIPKIISVDTIHENTSGSGVTVKDELSMDSNKITDLATPTANTDAVNKAYADGLVERLKVPVKVATTVAGTLASDFENGDTIDGVVLSTDDRILIKDQATGTENGIYIVNASGAPDRATDLETGDSASSILVFVDQGTISANKGYICTNNSGSDIVGTDNLSFSIFTENTTASNQGAGGVGVFLQKTNDDLEFKNINAGSSKITVSNDAGNNEIDIDVVEANLTLDNIGGVLSITKGGTGSTFGLDFKDSVRVATITAGTLATSFENGDTIDGVSLSTGDRILIKDQASATENGIYTVNASGAPTRTDDMPSTATIANAIIYVDEGDVNKNKGFICTNDSGSDVVGTDNLTFTRFSNYSIPIRVTNFTELSSAITAGELFIYLNAGTYTFTSTLTLASNTVLIGSGQNNTIFTPTGALGTNLITTSSNTNITIKGIQFDGNSEASVNSIVLGDGTTNIRIYDCMFTGNAGSTDAITSIGAGSGASNIWIQNCNFDTITGNGISQTTGDTYNIWYVNNCTFNTITGNPIDLLTTTRNINIQGCTIDTCGTIDLQGDGVNFNDNVVITTLTQVSDGKINIEGNFFRTISGTDCIDVADSSTIDSISIVGNHFETYSLNAIDLQCASATGCRINIQSNTFKAPTGGSAVAINVASNVGEGGSTGGNVIISGNMIESASTGEGNIVISSTGNPFVNVLNNGFHQRESYTGAVTIDGYSDELLVTTTGVTTATLPDLSIGSKGHKLYIELEVNGGNLTVTPSNAYNFTSVIMDTVAQYAIFEWTGIQWELKDISGNPTVNDYEFVVNTLTELTNAITMVGNASNGGSIKILGSITVTSPINVPSNCIIQGLDPSVSSVAGDDLNGGIFDVNTSTNVTFKNLLFDIQQTLGTATYGIESSTSNKVTAINCHFTDSSGSDNGTCVFNLGGSELLLSQCRIYDLNAIFTSTGNSNIISNCYIDNAGNAIFGGSYCKINDCYITGCGTISLNGINHICSDNIILNSTGDSLSLGTGSNYSIISNNTIDTSTTYGINTPGDPIGVSITGNTINSATIGIYMDGTYISVTGNTIKDTSTAGISVDTSCENFVISGNTLNNCDADGIDINSASNGEVSGNTVLGSTDGIDVSSAGALLKIGSNNIEESVTDPATLDGYTDRILVTTSTATGSTLGDLNAGSTGHRLYVELDVDVGDLTITPTSFANGTSIVLDDAGDYCIFEWTGSNWVLVDNQTSNNPSQTITVGTTTNLDSNPTVGNQQITRVGNIITFSATFQCNPTASATTSSFRVTLPDALTFNATAATANLECTSTTTGYYDTTTPTSLSNVFAVPVVSTSQLLISFTSSGTADDHFINLLARYSTV